MTHAIINAREILQDQIQEHDPEVIYCLYSGGNDSAVSTHLATRFTNATVAHIDTGIGFPCVQDHVREMADRYGWDLRIIGPGEHRGQTYEEWIRKNGMPGPTGHSFVYNHLKQRALEQLTRDAKQGWWDRVLFVSGVYAAESERRARLHTGVSKRKGARVLVNPCLHWSRSQMALYRRKYDIPQNPVTKTFGKSGECLCGAFARKGELERIRFINPELADRIERLEKMAYGPWGYEDRGPTKSWKMEQAGQQRLPLCTDCKI